MSPIPKRAKLGVAVRSSKPPPMSHLRRFVIFTFIERSKAVLEALRTRRIESVQGDVVDVADEVADEFERAFTRTRQKWQATQTDEEGSS